MGHLISDSGISIDNDKVKAIQSMPSPKNVKELRKFLGMINYLAKFIKNLSDEAMILRELDHKEVEWEWIEHH